MLVEELIEQLRNVDPKLRVLSWAWDESLSGEISLEVEAVSSVDGFLTRTKPYPGENLEFVLIINVDAEEE